MTRPVITRKRPDQFVGLVPTPGGRLGDPSPRDLSPKKNWVEEEGGLPDYIRMVRNALLEQGHDMARATSLAIGAIKRWAHGGGHVSPAVQAAAAEALAHWEAMRAKAHADDAVSAVAHAAGRSGGGNSKK